MFHPDSPLDNVRVASPCRADWDRMLGTERVRFCGQCELNVYNLSGMSRREAEALVAGTEGRVCVRYYRRADGSVLTKDCPVGLRALKRRASRVARATLSAVLGFLSGLGLNMAWSQSGRDEVREMGVMAVSLPLIQIKPKTAPPVEVVTHNDQLPVVGIAVVPDKPRVKGVKSVNPQQPRAGR